MGLTMHLFGITTEFDKTPVGMGMKYTMCEVGYWRKCWIIFYWFMREFTNDEHEDIECKIFTFDIYYIEKLLKDCKDTITYYDEYETAHRNDSLEDIPKNCLLGEDWNYFFYNRYEKSAYIAELEYTIQLCEELLVEDKYEEYGFEASV